MPSWVLCSLFIMTALLLAWELFVGAVIVRHQGQDLAGTACTREEGKHGRDGQTDDHESLHRFGTKLRTWRVWETS